MLIENSLAFGLPGLRFGLKGISSLRERHFDDGCVSEILHEAGLTIDESHALFLSLIHI